MAVGVVEEDEVEGEEMVEMVGVVVVMLAVEE